MRNDEECQQGAEASGCWSVRDPGAGRFVIKQVFLLRPVQRWLSNIPLQDPVDRRNAPFLQILLIFLGIFIPLNKSLYLYAVLSGRWSADLPARSAMLADLATDVLMTSAVWAAVWLIRTGRFRRGMHLFLGAVLLSMAVIYTTTGMLGLRFDPMPMILLALSGLVLGRRTLWITLATCVAILAATLIADYLRATLGGGVASVAGFGKAISLAGIWLIIAIALDRTVAALRISLDESNARGQELELAYTRLQEEVAERERTREQLVHAQKMEAVGRLASGVAHDFNNVLGIVLGQAAQRERLADKGATALYGALEDVELAAKRGLVISRKLLNFSRQDVARPQVFDARASLQELSPMLKQLFGGRVQLQLDCSDEALPVRMDADRFGLVVLNIAANARDAISGAGTFQITAAREDGAWVSLALADDGYGMTDAVRARAFDPFFTTKPIGMGTGLGLSVVLDMVLEAGGRVELAARQPQGSVVKIFLPLADLPGATPDSVGEQVTLSTDG